MIVAAIDIGSNTSLLLIARLSAKSGTIKDILEDQVFFTRLAEGLHDKGEIRKDSLKRQCTFFEKARKIINQYSVKKVKCVATAAARKAKNAQNLLYYGKKYGFSIDIISEKKEAQTSRKGALFKLPVNPDSSVVLDIGGASSEISTAQEFFSLPIGSVNLTEAFIHKNPPEKKEISLLINKIQKEINLIPFCFTKNSTLVATAGTPTTLAALKNKTDKLDDLHGQKINLEQVCVWQKYLFTLPNEKRKNLKGMPFYRADVMPAGLSILKQLMYHFQWNECTVSITGLRYGLLC